MSKTTITFLGDVHADWASLARAMAANPDTDIFIQVGDFGIGFGDLSELTLDRPVYFIDGNHDDHDFLADVVASGQLEIAPNLFYVPRGTQLDFNGTKINCLGGALSIDQHNRIEGVSWWANELTTYEELCKFMDLSPADIIVTHTAPLSVVSDFAGSKCDDPTSKDLDNVLRHMSYTPSQWFFGHFHETFDKTVNDTRFRCVPCTHDHAEAAHDGFTITV